MDIGSLTCFPKLSRHTVLSETAKGIFCGLATQMLEYVNIYFFFFSINKA